MTGQWGTNEAELVTFLQAFRSVQANTSWSVLFWVDPLDSSPLSNALRLAGYTDVHVLHWCKDVPGRTGPANHVQNIMKVCVMARLSPEGEEAQGCTMRGSAGRRSNLFKVKPSSKYLLIGRGNKVNADQKPVAIYKKILALFLVPGALVLIGGFGAGGEIATCLHLG